MINKMMDKFDLDLDKDLPLAILYVSGDESIGMALPFSADEMTDEDREVIQEGLNKIADRIVDIFDRINSNK